MFGVGFWDGLGGSSEEKVIFVVLGVYFCWMSMSVWLRSSSWSIVWSEIMRWYVCEERRGGRIRGFFV